MAIAKMQYCFNCGKELGVYIHVPHDIECCGAPGCNREMRNTYAQEREDAHERLDRDMGWS